MLNRRGAATIVFVCGLLTACATVSEKTRQAWAEAVEYYAPEDLLMLPSFGVEPSPTAIFDLEKKLARFGHVVANAEPCAPDESYFCLRGANIMPFAVPKEYSGERMWEFEGHTYRVLPDHGDFLTVFADGPTMAFYVDEPATFIEEQAFTRYVFIWSEDWGLIGWASGIHGCSISTAELMKLPAHDHRHACISRGFVVARGGRGLFADH